MMLDDYVLKGPNRFPGGGRALDYEKIVKVSDEDFAQLYLELMSELGEDNGWWEDGKIPKCSECNKVISSPEQLRLYHGLSMHPSCFKSYEIEETDTQVMAKYWQRVADLVLDY